MPDSVLDRKLTLPKRYETLARRANESAVNLDNIVARVDEPATRVENLLRQVRDGGVGRFELFLGLSGSGKTTFVKTLPLFFKDVTVQEVPKHLPLESVADFVRQRAVPSSSHSIFLMLDRDNDHVPKEFAQPFFESLRVLFREATGQVLVIYPITDEPEAKSLADCAFQVGRDSIVALEGGIYNFKGLPKDKYYGIADTTARTFSGSGLESFGLTKTIADAVLPHADTISSYYSLLETKSAEINQAYRDVLKEKIIPEVWVVLAGDDGQAVHTTVANVTHGTQKAIDVDRLGEILDDQSNDSLYLKEWRARRDRMGQLMQILQAKILELPPNVALGAIRRHGDADEL